MIKSSCICGASLELDLEGRDKECELYQEWLEVHKRCTELYQQEKFFAISLAVNKNNPKSKPRGSRLN
jgi:hypothetical protein